MRTLITLLFTLIPSFLHAESLLTIESSSIPTVAALTDQSPLSKLIKRHIFSPFLASNDESKSILNNDNLVDTFLSDSTGLTWTFFLEKRVKFSSGREVNVFHLKNLIMSLKNNSIYARLFDIDAEMLRNIKEIETLPTRKIRLLENPKRKQVLTVHLQKQDFRFDEKINSLPVFDPLLLEQFVESQGRTLNVGNFGLYQITRFVPGKEITIRPTEKRAELFPKITFRKFRDLDNAKKRMIEGKIHGYVSAPDAFGEENLELRGEKIQSLLAWPKLIRQVP